MIGKTLAAVFIFALTTALAFASVSIEGNKTLTDAQGGTLELTTSGQTNAAGSDSTTTALFNDFQGVQARRTINGEVVRERSRGESEAETRYSGILEIASSAGPDGPVTLNVLEFDSLTVNRSGEGPVFSGVVVFNGESIDGNALSDSQKRTLRRTLRFFRFA